jgi:UDP-sugar diphosphatase
VAAPPARLFLLTTTRTMATSACQTTATAPKHMPDDPYPHALQSIGGCKMSATLERLGADVAVGPLPSSGSAFIRPASVAYSLDGKKRRWDVIEAHASVGVVLYHEDLDAFLIVRQFRPAVYATLLAASAASAAGAPSSSSSPPPLHAAFTYELCAGLCDKDKPMQEIAAEEILEECGFVVPPEQVRFVTQAVSSAGTAGAPHALFFARVSDALRAAGEQQGGGGLADTGEAIEVLALPFEKAEEMVLDGKALSMSPGLQFGLTWARAEMLAGRLGGRKGGMGGGKGSDGFLTEELTLKPVLPA